MLPPEDHEMACRLFCRILKRLEERERRNGKKDFTNSIGTGTSLPLLETGTSDGSLLSSVSPCEQPRTEEERLGRNAAR